MPRDAPDEPIRDRSVRRQDVSVEEDDETWREKANAAVERIFSPAERVKYQGLGTVPTFQIRGSLNETHNLYRNMLMMRRNRIRDELIPKIEKLIPIEYQVSGETSADSSASVPRGAKRAGPLEEAPPLPRLDVAFVED